MYGKTMYTETGEPLPGVIGEGSSSDQGSQVYQLTSNDDHINYVDDAWVFESLEDLDFSEGSDRYTFLLVVHENPLEGHYLSRSLLDRFMDLTGKRSGRG
jgi:hypothetical protein